MAEYVERERLTTGVLGLTIVDPMVAQYADAVLLQIQQAPAADVVPVVHGRWLDTGCYGESKNPIFVCSECHRGVEDYFIKNHKFCLHCGARMDGE